MVPPSTLWGALDPRGPFNSSQSKTPLWVALILPRIFPPGSLSSHGHYSNMDSALTPFSPTQATHLGLLLHERYPMAHDLSPTIHPSLWQLIPVVNLAPSCATRHAPVGNDSRECTLYATRNGSLSQQLFDTSIS